MSTLRKTWKVKDTTKMCHAPWNKGKKTGLVPKTAFKKGHIAPITAIKKGAIAWNKGIKRYWKSPTEFKKGDNLGILNSNWKGGITPESFKIRQSIESKLWIQSVFARDGYTCQKTGVKGGKLTAHHILNFSSHPELRFAIDNGVSLSVTSHKEFHHIYGRKNNTREQLLEFLNTK